MKTIIEVGADTGTETFHFLLDAEAEVWSFEPEQALFKVLFRESRQYPRLHVFPFAVDIGDNQEPLFHYENGLSTMQPPAFGTRVATNFTMTWTIRLDTFMGLYSIGKVDYLRIDAPLREEMILESLGDRIKDVEKGRVSRYEHVTSIVGNYYMANVGGALHGHPQGTLAGCAAMRQAIDHTYGEEYQKAIETWGLIN